MSRKPAEKSSEPKSADPIVPIGNRIDGLQEIVSALVEVVGAPTVQARLHERTRLRKEASEKKAK